LKILEVKLTPKLGKMRLPTENEKLGLAETYWSERDAGGMEMSRWRASVLQES